MTRNTDYENVIAEFGIAALTPVFNRDVPILWRRSEDGQLMTNVVWQVVEHSPTGFEIGYGGSGPADFALNVMAALFPIENGDPAIKCFQGTASGQAWQLHQEFKFAFLCGANRLGGCIEWQEIELWLAAQAAQ
jgi:hypothetical protein